MINKIVIDNDDLKKEYKPIIKVATDNEEYMIYTKNETNKIGDIICYAASYSFCDGKQVLLPIKDQNKLEVLDSIFVQVQNLVNKKVSEKHEK